MIVYPATSSICSLALVWYRLYFLGSFYRSFCLNNTLTLNSRIGYQLQKVSCQITRTTLMHIMPVLLKANNYQIPFKTQLLLGAYQILVEQQDLLVLKSHSWTFKIC